MIYNFKPSDVCSSMFHIDIDENGVIKSLVVDGGCEGYARGLGLLLAGRTADEVAALLEGVICESSVTGATSCPDQISKMLRGINRQ